MCIYNCSFFFFCQKEKHLLVGQVNLVAWLPVEINGDLLDADGSMALIKRIPLYSSERQRQ